MNYQRIKKLQKLKGFSDIQSKIDSGLAWKLEGSVGRFAMACLEEGTCMLPKVTRQDFYGNLVPSRDMLKAGTKGTYLNSVNFWTEYEKNN